MTTLQLRLRFLCHQCEEGIHLTVQCRGKGLQAGPRTVAAVNVNCPQCQSINEVCFHPTGTVVAVRPGDRVSRLPVPSCN